MEGWWRGGRWLVEGWWRAGKASWEVQLQFCFVFFFNSVQVSFQDAESAEVGGQAAAVEAAEAPEPRWM